MYFGMISYPFKMLDFSFYTEGTYALILMSEEKFNELKIENPVWVMGIGFSNQKYFTGARNVNYRWGNYGNIVDL